MQLIFIINAAWPHKNQRSVFISPTDTTIPLAFIAGALSFISPCVLPLVPVYLRYLSDSLQEEANEKERVNRIQDSFMTDKYFNVSLLIKTHDFVGFSFITSFHARRSDGHVGHRNAFHIRAKQ